MAAPLFAFEHVTLPGAERARLDDVRARAPGRRDHGDRRALGRREVLAAALLQPARGADGGVVRYRGEDIAARDPLAHRREVAMVFQKPVLFAGSVADNLRVADPEADDERIAELLRRAALDPRRSPRATPARSPAARGSASASRARWPPTRTRC